MAQLQTLGSTREAFPLHWAMSLSSRCPPPRWRRCDAIPTCDHTTPYPLCDWTRQPARWTHQMRDGASPSRFACMWAIVNAKAHFQVGVLHQRASLLTNTAMCSIKAPSNSQTIQLVDGSEHHHATQSTQPEICIFSLVPVTAGIQNTSEHCKHLSVCFSST